ncbi:MAG: peptidase T, partial [Oscillospiraceae bacterium]|nr:peptidase T [Oscillospiraceae bacterium]
MRAYERFLKYVTVHTASSEESETTPSTQIQFDLANLLRDEMLEMGISDARVDEHCYVYGSIPATEGCENAPCIGFIAHLDTIPDFSGENVKPRLVENYDGSDIVLGASGRTLSQR